MLSLSKWQEMDEELRMFSSSCSDNHNKQDSDVSSRLTNEAFERLSWPTKDTSKQLKKSKRLVSRTRKMKAKPLFTASFLTLVSIYLLALPESNLSEAQFLQAASPLQDAPRPRSSNLTSSANNLTASSSPSSSSKADFLLSLVKTSFSQHQQQQQQQASASAHQQAGNRTLVPFLKALENEKKQRAGQQREHYKTVYACEGNQLDLSCPDGKLIHLSRALYGRFSLSICNDLGHSNFSVQCASFRAFLIMETRCNKLSNCSVTASKELFGDPCEGTSKYLEVQYYCHDVNQQSPQNAAAGNQQQQAAASIAKINNNNNNQEQTQKSETIVVGNSQPSPDTPSLASHKSHNLLPSQQSDFVVGGSQQQQQQQNEASQGNSNQQQDASQSVANDGQQSSTVISLTNGNGGAFCQPQTSPRNMFWNLTRFEQINHQACPEGSYGKASWFCDGSTGRFSPTWSPDFSQCRLIWLHNVERKLDRILTDISHQHQYQSLQTQCDRISSMILSDLVLMARTKELFGEDLRKIDNMLTRITNLYRNLQDLLPDLRVSAQAVRPIYEDFFSQLVDLVSSLFDQSQRNGWLEINQPELRRQLELGFLNHLKESALLLSAVWVQNNDQQPATTNLPFVSRPNVHAGLTALISASIQPSNYHNILRDSAQATETREFNLAATSARAQFNYQDKLYHHHHHHQQQQQQQQSAEDQTSNNNYVNDEFLVNTLLAKELISKGATRFLVVNVKKPDYALIRQQLESNGNSLDNLLAVSEQQLSQVFGFFAIDDKRVLRNEDVFAAYTEPVRSGDPLLAMQQSIRWPLKVDFKQPSNANQRLLQRDCNLLPTGDEQLGSGRCQTVSVNATSHLCRCDAFGFVSLSSAASNNLVPTNSIFSNDPHWPAGNGLGNQQSPLNDYLEHRTLSGLEALNGRSTSQQQSSSVWRTLLVICGCLVAFVLFAGCLVSAFLRASSQSRLNKKNVNGGFLAATNNCNSIFGNQHRAGGPTTGPLPAGEHSLIAGDSLVTSSSASNSNSATTHSSSIIGLSNSAACYKTHQQLYASHLADPSNRLTSNNWPRWMPSWLRPTGWLSSLVARASGAKEAHIQHRMIGGANVTGTMASYKTGQYQNGYTTSLHHPLHQHHHLQMASGQASGARLPIAAAGPASSSTSSYVSSSAYYEEIGPGNLAKINAGGQLANSRTLTIVDPFKVVRSNAVANDQQQLISNNSLASQHPLNGAGGQQSPWHQQNTSLSYSINGPSSNYNEQQQMFVNKQEHEQQHLPPTPRHYLFASSTAVNAYKSSMGQPMHYHQHDHNH